MGAYGATPALHLDHGFFLVLEANETTRWSIFEPLGDAVEQAVLTARY